jgi:hypothetical protein
VSVEHTRYVWTLEVPGIPRYLGSFKVKLVLLCYADHANTHGECWPSTDRVARMTQMDPRSVEKARTHLVQLGHLVPLWTGGAAGHGGRGRTNRYLVPLPENPGPSPGFEPEKPRPITGVSGENPGLSPGFESNKPRPITGVSGKTPAHHRGLESETPADCPETPAYHRPNHQEPEPPRARAREAVGPADRPDPFRAAGNPTPIGELIRPAGIFSDEQWARLQTKVSTPPPAGGAPTNDASSGASSSDDERR